MPNIRVSGRTRATQVQQVVALVYIHGQGERQGTPRTDHGQLHLEENRTKETEEVSYKCLMYGRNESEYIFNKTRKARVPRSESKENKLKTKMTSLQMAAQIGGRENTSEN